MTKYPSLDRYLSPLSPITCTADPPPPSPLPLLFPQSPFFFQSIPNFSSLLYHFLSERKQASTIFAGFPRLFSEKRIRGKRGKWVRETKAQSNNGPGYTRDRPSTSLFTREPLFRLSFFQGCRYESWSPVLVNRRWTTRCEHEQRRDGDRDPVYCLSWVPNYRNSLINAAQVKRERQSERAADRR